MGGGWYWGWVCTALIPLLPTPVFPDTKPYEAAETFGVPPGKVGAAGPGAPWEKGRGSEVSVMLTVSAAAAKVSEGMEGGETLVVLVVTAAWWYRGPGHISFSCGPEPQRCDGGHG